VLHLNCPLEARQTTRALNSPVNFFFFGTEKCPAFKPELSTILSGKIVENPGKKPWKDTYIALGFKIIVISTLKKVNGYRNT
jgi:hypothetical protein